MLYHLPMKLKVFGGLVFVGRTQKRCVIATTSQAKAAEAAGVNIGYIRDYWSITGNAAEVAAALSMPEVALVREDHYSGAFFPLANFK
jgi:hypothetical protein